MSTEAADIADMVGDLLVELGLRSPPTAALAAGELGELLATPWADWNSSPTLRSSLTESGAPFELSIKLDAGQGLSLRYVVDVADHRTDLHANAERYVRVAEQVTAVDLRALFDHQLAAVPPGSPPRVMIGVGFAGGRRRRSTVYFSASSLDHHDRVEFFPAAAVSIAEGDRATIDDAVEVVGYDVSDGVLSACKTYRWLTVGPHVQLPASVSDFNLAQAVVHGEFVADVPPALRARATFLQRTVSLIGPGSPSDKLFFFSRAWGWADPAGLGRLFTLLTGRLGVDLRPLLLIRAAAGRHGLPLHIGLVSVGGPSASPTVTCYFWPVAS